MSMGRFNLFLFYRRPDKGAGKISLADFQRDVELGKGCFGSVTLVQRHSDGRTLRRYAMKTVHKKNTSKDVNNVSVSPNNISQ